MRETKLTIIPTTQFRKDYKLARKRGLKIELLQDVIACLAMGEPLPEKNRDHALTGDWVGVSYPAGLAAGLSGAERCSGADLDPHRHP